MTCVVTKVAVGLVVAILTAGCAGSGGSQELSSPSAAVPAAPSTASSSQSPVEAHWQEVVDFVRAVHVDDLDTAYRLAAPGSAAHRYLMHQEARLEAEWAVGYVADSQSAFDADPDAQTVTVTVTWGGEVNSHTWSDFEVDVDGRVRSWTGESGPVEEALWSSNNISTAVAGTKIELVSAYRSNSGDLFVVLEVTPSEFSVTPDPSPQLVDQENRVREPSSWLFPNEIAKGSTGHAVYVYEGAKFGGELTYEVTDGDGRSRAIATIPIE